MAQRFNAELIGRGPEFGVGVSADSFRRRGGLRLADGRRQRHAQWVRVSELASARRRRNARDAGEQRTAEGRQGQVRRHGRGRPRARDVAERVVSVPRNWPRLCVKSRPARTAFEALASSPKKEYAEWIAGAKKDKTPGFWRRRRWPCWPRASGCVDGGRNLGGCVSLKRSVFVWSVASVALAPRPAFADASPAPNDPAAVLQALFAGPPASSMFAADFLSAAPFDALRAMFASFQKTLGKPTAVVAQGGAALTFPSEIGTRSSRSTAAARSRRSFSSRRLRQRAPSGSRRCMPHRSWTRRGSRRRCSRWRRLRRCRRRWTRCTRVWGAAERHAGTQRIHDAAR